MRGTGRAPLAEGEVAYELLDGASGGEDRAAAALPPLVLVHGILGPMAIWDRTLAPLAAAGRSVLRYDLYGRGASARPRVRYDLDLFVAQLGGLLDALDLGRAGAPVDLLGLSMGGAVAVGFTARFPERVRRLGLIAPAGLPRARPGVVRVAQAVAAPLVGEAVMGLLGRAIVRRGLRASFLDPDREPVRGYVARAAAQGEDADFRRALLSTMRAMPLESMTDDFARAGRGRDVLLVWGTADAIAPVGQAERARAAIPHLEARLVDGAAHNLHYEEPDRVNPLLIDFFGR